MRVLLLTQFFDPEPTLKGLTFATELQRMGHEVDVLTGFPNYPGGKLYPGYRMLPWKQEMVDGIRITRVALYPSHDRSAIKRIMNYISFALMAAVCAPFLVRRPDVVYVHHPPPTIALPAMVIRGVFGAPFVYEVQDLWPDTLSATGMIKRGTLLRLIGTMCRRIYASANHVVVISKGFKERLLARGISADRLSVIYNWCDEHRIERDVIDQALAKELGLDQAFIVMFAGTMGLAQGLDAVLDAAELCSTQVPGARFVFVGGGVERDRLQQTATARRLHNVSFIPRQPIEMMGRILALADAQLVHLRDDPLFSITVPSKTQVSLYMGVPVIMAVRGDGADLVEASRGGILCEPESATSIADAVARMAGLSAAERAEMGRCGREFYDRELSLAAGCRTYEKLLSDVVSGGAMR
jgi:colanic acid biosynthesis glycosyl transferase WcaI